MSTTTTRVLKFEANLEVGFVLFCCYPERKKDGGFDASARKLVPC
jgi:hypothetical protein